MRKLTKAAAAAIAMASLAACGSNDKQAKSASVQPIQGPYAPAGSKFVATLQRALGTSASPPGTPFEARVQSDIMTPDGQVLVAKNAPLSGKVVDVALGVKPSIKLDFEKIATVTGDAPIAATVTSAQEYAWVDSTYTYDPATGYEAQLYHPLYHPGYVPPRPVPPGTNPAVIQSGEFVLPEGLELTLVLTRPLLAPTAFVRPGG